MKLYVDQINVNGIVIYSGNGDPNGVLTATRGSLYSDKLTGDLWNNISGTDVWRKGSGGSSPLTWGMDQISETTTTRYLSPGYGYGLANISETFWPAPADGELSLLYMTHTDLGAAPEPIVYTVMVGGVATSLAVTLNANASSGSNLVNTASVLAGQRVSIRATKAGTLTSAPTRIVGTMLFIPS